MNMERNQGIQFLSREEIRAYQEKRMAEALDYVSKNSPFYSKLFSDNHIDISKIRTLDDLSCIPVTTKPDLQSRNQDFVCVPPSEIVDYPTTSGTLGDPVTFAETESDLEHLAYNEFLSFSTAGFPGSTYTTRYPLIRSPSRIPCPLATGSIGQTDAPAP